MIISHLNRRYLKQLHRDANGRSVSQEVTRVLWKLKVHCRIQTGHHVDVILRTYANIIGICQCLRLETVRPRRIHTAMFVLFARGT
jgi:hypothetical protein